MLQCLAQTPFLKKCLLDISESVEPITLKLDKEDIVSINIPIINITNTLCVIIKKKKNHFHQ